MLQLGASSANRACWLRLHWPGVSACAYQGHTKFHTSALEQISDPGPISSEMLLLLESHAMWPGQVCHQELHHSTQSNWHRVRSPAEDGIAGFTLLPISFLAVWSVEGQRRLLITSAQLLLEACPQEPGCQQEWATCFHNPLGLRSQVWQGAQLKLASSSKALLSFISKVTEEVESLITSAPKARVANS